MRKLVSLCYNQIQKVCTVSLNSDVDAIQAWSLADAARVHLRGLRLDVGVVEAAQHHAEVEHGEPARPGADLALPADAAVQLTDALARRELSHLRQRNLEKSKSSFIVLRRQFE